MERGRQASDASSSTRRNQSRFGRKPSLGAEAGCRDFESGKGADPRAEYEVGGLRIVLRNSEAIIERIPSRGGNTSAPLRASLGIHRIFQGLEVQSFGTSCPVLQEGCLQRVVSRVLQVRTQTRFRNVWPGMAASPSSGGRADGSNNDGTDRVLELHHPDVAIGLGGHSSVCS